jgi:RND family efflux transporter MFP subunit
MAELAGHQRKSGGIKLFLTRFFTFILPVLVIVGGVGTVVVMGALKQPPEKSEPVAEAPKVVTSTTETEAVRLTVSNQGVAEPRVEIDVVPQVGGRIDYVSPAFISGGGFEKDEVLIRIEDVDYALAVTRAEAEVSRAARALARERAEADIAQRDWEELGDGEASELALRQPQLAEARATLAAAQAALEDAKLDLARTEIRAPFDGRVAMKSADAGQFVNAGQSLGRIFSTNVIEVRLPLSDRELAKTSLPVAFQATEQEPGPAVELSAVVAGEYRIWNGRITRTDSRFDQATRLLYAIAEVEDPYGAGAADGAPLAPGLFVNAEIEGRFIDDAVVMPRTALRSENQVYVVTDDDTLSVREVRVVSSDRERVVVTSGVAAGEQVVVSPLRGAAEGMAVTPVAPEVLAGETDAEDASAERAVSASLASAG